MHWRIKMVEDAGKIKTILHLNASNFYGGPEKQIIEHLKRLNKDLFKGIVVAFQNGSKRNEILTQADEEKIKNIAIPSNGALDKRAYNKLKSILRENNVDLLCTHGFKSTVNGWWAARKLGIPVIAFSRGFTAENRKVAFYEWIERLILRKVNGVISVSYGQKKKLEDYGINRKENWVVHNAVSINHNRLLHSNFKLEFFKKYNIPKDSLLAVSAGRLSPEKGHIYLLKAIPKINSQKNIIFIFAGSGVLKNSLELEAQNAGIDKNCRFIGFCKNISNLFNIMDFFVLPSLTEGLPNVVLESFSFKKPVIATNVGGVSEVLTNNKNGILIPSQNPDLLAEAISLISASHELRQKMGEQGYLTVVSNFSFEKQNKELESIYNKILVHNN